MDLTTYRVYAISEFGENSFPVKYVDNLIKRHGPDYIFEDSMIMVLMLNEIAIYEKKHGS